MTSLNFYPKFPKWQTITRKNQPNNPVFAWNPLVNIFNYSNREASQNKNRTPKLNLFLGKARECCLAEECGRYQDFMGKNHRKLCTELNYLFFLDQEDGYIESWQKVETAMIGF